MKKKNSFYSLKDNLKLFKLYRLYLLFSLLQARQKQVVVFKTTNTTCTTNTTQGQRHEKDSLMFYCRKNACIMKDQGKAFQAIAYLQVKLRTSSSLSFRVCTRLPTSQAMCIALQARLIKMVFYILWKKYKYIF